MTQEYLDMINRRLVQFCWIYDAPLIQFSEAQCSASDGGNRIVSVQCNAVKLTCDDAESWARRCMSGGHDA